MEKLGYVNSFLKIVGYSLVPRRLKARITQRRLKKLVRYAKANSPFYAKLYETVGEDFALADLPPVNKQLMHRHFDAWHTERGISFEDVKAFIHDERNIGKKYLGRYTIVMTSGTTGEPAIILQDASIQNLSAVMGCLRCVKFRFPIVNICDDTGYGIDNESVRHNKGKASILDKLMCVVDSKQPMEDLVAQLNRIRPKILFGYVGVISGVANEALAGRLKIKPGGIFTAGEYLSEGMRKKITQAFPGVHVHSIYGSTEAGAIAYECDRCDHLHVNEDWTILESVDENGDPVPYGQRGAKVYMTNLANYLHPLIRYEVNDRVTLHKDDCPCGKKGVWLEVEGRSHEVLAFDTPKGKVEVPSLVLYEIVGTISNFGIDHYKSFQLVLTKSGVLELRLDCYDGVDPQKMLERVADEVQPYLQNCGISAVEMVLSAEKPRANTRTGKMVCVYQEK